MRVQGAVLYLADVGVLDGPGPVDAVVDGGLVGEPGAGAVPGGPEPPAAAAEDGEGRRWILGDGGEAGARWQRHETRREEDRGCGGGHGEARRLLRLTAIGAAMRSAGYFRSVSVSSDCRRERRGAARPLDRKRRSGLTKLLRGQRGPNTCRKR